MIFPAFASCHVDNREEPTMSRSLTLLLAVVPLAAFAQNDDSYRCTHDGLVRRVEIVRETGAAVPCAVRYTKDTEASGQPQVLWKAEHEQGYCEARTREFIAKLESLGWQCAAVAAAGAADGAARD
jgi:hypothetical protein